MDIKSKHLRIAPMARLSYEDDIKRLAGVDEKSTIPFKELYSRAIKRQLSDVGKLIELRGGTPTEPYVDDGFSAYNPTVVRDEFERWLKDFIENRNDGIAAYDLDRIVRQPKDLERIIQAYDDAAKKYRPTIFWLIQGSIDLSTSDGRTMARVLVAFANKSSMDTARRLSSFYLHEAKQGNIYNNHAPMGRNKDDSINKTEAELLNWMAAEVIAGVPPTRVATQLREQGLVTKRGGRYTGHAVRRYLLDPGIAGIAVYDGKPLLDDDGNYIMRKGGPIISVDDWEQIHEALSSRGFSKYPSKSLLGGIARCERCGYGMVRQLRAKGRYSYSCRSKDSGGCASVSINGNRLDVLITELMVELLQNEEVESKQTPPGFNRLTEIAQQRKEVMELYTAKQISLSDMVTLIDKLDQERRTLQSQIGHFKRKQRPTVSIAEEFPNLPVLKQRAAIKTFIKAIVVAPSGRTGFFDPSRISIVYAD